ncbi:Tau-tubulin kinase [Trichinella pseudospiralis]
MGAEKAATLFSKGDLVEDRWQIISILGKGNFGAVYEVYDTKDKINEAMKVEAADQTFHTLKVEAAVLEKSNKENCRHTCKLYGVGRKASYSYIAMTLVGPNLSSMLKTLGCGANEQATFSMRTAIHVGIEALEAIEDLHRIGFLHRDIKPHNFACGRAPDYRNLYLLDFGLCRNYMRKDGKITTGKFPWGDFSATHLKNKRKHALVFGVKKTECCSTAPQMAAGAPTEFMNIAGHILSLEYYDAPNYDFLHSCLKNLMKRLKIQPEHLLDWEPENGMVTQGASGSSYNTAVENNVTCIYLCFDKQ